MKSVGDCANDVPVQVSLVGYKAILTLCSAIRGGVYYSF